MDHQQQVRQRATPAATENLLSIEQMQPEGVIASALQGQLAAQGMSFVLGPQASWRRLYLLSLAGIAPLAAGRVLYQGRDLTQWEATAQEELRQQLVCVMQPMALLSVRNARDNLLLPALYHGQPERLARARMEQALAEIQFAGDLTQLPAFLSPLERVQLALVRARLLQPKIFLIEDPWLGLDWLDCASIEAALRLWSQDSHLVISGQALDFAAQHAEAFFYVSAEHQAIYGSWSALLASDSVSVRQYCHGYRSGHPPAQRE